MVVVPPAPGTARGAAARGPARLALLASYQDCGRVGPPPGGRSNCSDLRGRDNPFTLSSAGALTGAYRRAHAIFTSMLVSAHPKTESYWPFDTPRRSVGALRENGVGGDEASGHSGANGVGGDEASGHSGRTGLVGTKRRGTQQLSWKSSDLGGGVAAGRVPASLVADHDIDDRQQLPHRRRQRYLLCLARRAQPGVELLDDRICDVWPLMWPYTAHCAPISCRPTSCALPLNSPLSLLNGATPTREAISLRFRRPNSGSSAMITLDTTGPTPGTLVSRSSLALHTGLDRMNSLI